MPEDSSTGEASVKGLADLDFGTYIAFFLPGILAFYGLSPLSANIADLFGKVTAKDEGLGAAFLLLIAGLILGTLVSGIRAVTLDPLLHLIGRVKKPELNYASLRSEEERVAYNEALANTYRFYQFYGNMVLSLALFGGVRYVIEGVNFRTEKSVSYLILFTLICLIVQSRQSLQGTYKVLGQILGVIDKAPRPKTSETLPSGTITQQYNYPLEATDGTPPYTWALSHGALPTSLTLAAGGSISGTPTATGVFLFILNLTDSKGKSRLCAFSMEIK
jgi:hypothetical protein